MFAPPRPAPTGDALDAWSDHDTYGPYANTAAMAAYQALFAAHPLIATAMDYSGLHADQREAIWNALDAAETLTYVADIANPVDYPSDPFDTGPAQTYVILTRTETIDSYAAKIAHALYHDLAETFPWRLSGYAEDELRGLLDGTEVFDIYDTEGGTPGRFSRFCDHSPKRVYDYTESEIATSEAPRRSVTNLIENIVGAFRHSSISVPDPLHAVAMDDAWTDKVSRTGCHFASPMACALARSVNLPARLHYGYYYGDGHHNMSFLTADATLAHGDDPYNAALDGWYGAERCDSYADWEANILPLDPYPSADPTLRQETGYRTGNKAYTRISPSYTDAFANPAKGWLYAGADFVEFMSQAEQDDFYANLAALTGVTGTPLGGKLTISIAPDSGQGWTLSGPGGTSGNGDAALWLETGNYSIVFDDDLIEYTKPADDSAAVTHLGSGPTLSGTYVARAYGEIRIDIEGNVSEPCPQTVFGSWTVTSDDFPGWTPLTGTGCRIALGAGALWQGRDYTITFDPEVGYTEPPSQQFTISASKHTVTATYIPD